MHYHCIDVSIILSPRGFWSLLPPLTMTLALGLRLGLSLGLELPSVPSLAGVPTSGPVAPGPASIGPGSGIPRVVRSTASVVSLAVLWLSGNAGEAGAEADGVVAGGAAVGVVLVVVGLLVVEGGVRGGGGQGRGGQDECEEELHLRIADVVVVIG